MLPGAGVVRIVVTDPAWSARDSARAAAMKLFLDPGGPVEIDKVRPIPSADGRGVEMAEDHSFLTALASARSIRLERKGRIAFRAELPDSAGAVRALLDCEEGALREWGFDIAARAALSRLPRPAGVGAVSWFRWQDYPEEAVLARASGMVVARISVDSSGRAAACAVVVGAGHASLDRRTCQSIMERARFEPALDSKGKPVGSEYIVRTVWQTR
jgi:TonB family protein